MRQGSFPSLGPHGFHRVAYTEWGAADNPEVVVCVHGLTRTGRDFDRLARVLAEDFRVVCPDVVGRGLSDRLAAKEDYAYPVYCADMATLIARLQVDRVRWVGTSMGGLVGMMLAAQPNTPIVRMVMNDVGPLVPKAAIARLRTYVGEDPRFASFAALECFVRQVYAPFGELGDDGWRELAAASGQRLEDGSYALAYDPDIAVNLRAGPLEDAMMWPVWDAVRCPVQVLHGVDSDILLADTCKEMVARHPATEMVHLEGVGHAPSLMVTDQIALVRDYLRG